MNDSYGAEIKKGSVLGVALIGFSGSGCQQHLRRLDVKENNGELIIDSEIKTPGNCLKMKPVEKLLKDAFRVKVLNKSSVDKFPHNETLLIFEDRYPFKDV